jgi:hypothetical protein
VSRRGGKQRTPAQVAAHQAEIAQRYLRGETQQVIATALGLDQGQVSRDLAKVVKQWQAEALHDIDAAKAAELARINTLEREYWAAWDASKQPKETTTTEQVDAKEKRARAQIQRQERDGDPRYLAGVQWCIDRRCKLLGLDAPVKQDLTTNGKDLTSFAALMQMALAANDPDR